MASFVFDVGSDGVAKGTIDWVNDTDIRMLLLTGAGTPVKGNATVLAALAEANVDESTATNYSRAAMANKSISTTGNKTLFDADNPVFSSLGGASNDTITGWIIYKGTAASGDDGSNIPISYTDLTTDLTTNGGDVTATKDATNKWLYLDNT